MLVGDYTDLLVLLISHAKNYRTYLLFFRPKARWASQKENRCWNIPVMRALLGSVVTNNMLFLLAILGCDTTSGVYGLRKSLTKISTGVIVGLLFIVTMLEVSRLLSPVSLI